ncbi:MAG TPA: tetratricopeptide repeat protein, partial [Chitinophagaceae bacterium]|nr:tetratricopeptide repeat protein [Chitinophagaceae bacterium]
MTPIKKIFILFFIALSTSSFAQKANSLVMKGNEAYKKGDYANAAALYKQAIENDPKLAVAVFNLGNAFYRQNKYLDAAKYFDEVLQREDDDNFKSRILYNKGMVLVRQQKLPEAADAFKQSLMLNPADNDARENLQKVLNALKLAQQKPDNKKQNKQPAKPKDTKMNRDLMEQKFNELRNQEKQLQKLLQKKNNTEQ